MTENEKFESQKDQLAGKAKEAGGKLTDDKELEAEGKTQSTAGKAKEKLADAKETAKGAVDELKRKLKD
ncbi:CsbD family protein [Loigolactobacillus bifermentans]|jgi:uncharacterized protein YjbJ (UPF0337 family)|uniref:CsbD-like domain-containing protein n=1 Tax=Loigolactobacillus bifermentans DSM 20003 TaxID=1423726 RepID=A0A0R1GM42_9LACO|nr:CsbD family protein [Loigolactobacillus bifermentans]KRK33009.1 hypothetical protein FC07_GL001548 [Loigolactobacillus bifermentans DSM 20003]QGG61354.1 CsbD family protein [Loigolactobacillus bifermentans]